MLTLTARLSPAACTCEFITEVRKAFILKCHVNNDRDLCESVCFLRTGAELQFVVSTQIHIFN